LIIEVPIIPEAFRRIFLPFLAVGCPTFEHEKDVDGCVNSPLSTLLGWYNVRATLPYQTYMKRTASAVWHGDLKKGQGTVSTQSGVLNKTQYSFSTRFEDGIGTNPEELIAAAHAGCFTMALSAFLGGAGFTPEELSTEATLTLEQVDGNWTITAVHLDLTGRVPGLDAAKFDEIADQAKAGCPVSRVLKADITLTKKFQS
jgi:lipoyl-dependent peroxiredoxin